MAKYGLIGNPLGHSVSPKIHGLLGLKDYVLVPLEEDKVGEFALNGGFDGFNVTIPYKQAIIPFLSSIEGAAREIGAVNTVVRTAGGLVGYNTDVDGMRYALRKAEITLDGKNVLILGTGGTSKTAAYVANTAGARSVTKAGRTQAINYENVYSLTETEVIINTTPVGMFPNVDCAPVDLEPFGRLSGVFDCIYNPKETVLVKQARERGIPAANGLLMLIEQARKAEEKFFGRELPEALSDEVAKKL